MICLVYEVWIRFKNGKFEIGFSNKTHGDYNLFTYLLVYLWRLSYTKYLLNFRISFNYVSRLNFKKNSFYYWTFKVVPKNAIGEFWVKMMMEIDTKIKIGRHMVGKWCHIHILVFTHYVNFVIHFNGINSSKVLLEQF